MARSKKNKKVTDKKDKDQENEDEKIEEKTTLLTDKTESEGELLLGDSDVELLKADYENDIDLVEFDSQFDRSKQSELLLGTEEGTEKENSELLMTTPQEGELLTSEILTSSVEPEPVTTEIQEIKDRTAEEIIVVFDKNLNERGKIDDSYSSLKDFLEQNNVRCHEYTNVLTQANLASYDCLIFACPDASRLNKFEIEEITRFVEAGGGLLLLSHAGGDRGRATNLNELSLKFGIQFVNDQVLDELNNIGLNTFPIIDDLHTHNIFTNVKNFCLRAGCSIEVSGNAKLIAHADAIAEPTNAGIIAINELKLGRVIAVGSYEMFRNQIPGGIKYETHPLLFLNILDWLTENKNVARLIQTIEKVRIGAQKMGSRAETSRILKKDATKTKFKLPVLTGKTVQGIEDFDGLIFGFNELKDEFQDLKIEVSNNLKDINSAVEGVSMGSVREIETLKEEIVLFKEDINDFKKTLNSFFKTIGKEIENMNKKIDKLISIDKKKTKS